MTNVIPLFDLKLQRTLSARQFHPSNPAFGRDKRQQDTPDATDTCLERPQSDDNAGRGPQRR